MIDGSKRSLVQVKDIRNFLDSVLDDDIHTKRIASLANATHGVMTGVALARESTRFAWVSSERILPRKFRTSLNCMHVRFVQSIILLNKAAIVELYNRFIHADASAGNEGILEGRNCILAITTNCPRWKASKLRPEPSSSRRPA